MMKHLMLISNISLENKRLLEYTSDFCKHYKCKLHVLHISNYSEPVLISSASYYNQNNIEYNKHFEEKSAENVASKVSKILDKEMVQVAIKKGNQEKILNNFLTDNFIDLIVIGNKDIDAKSDFHDHKNILLNIVDTPLLVVPDLQVFSPFSTLNFLTTHTERDIDNIILLSKLFSDAAIKVSHMGKSDSELGVKERNWQQYLSSKIKNETEFNRINENISDYVRRENYSITKMSDAFVFTARKRKFWARLIDPSTTLSYLAGLEMPSIIFKYSE